MKFFIKLANFILNNFELLFFENPGEPNRKISE